ncbi:MAG: hypothetical protein RL235_435 [Chlamydiota bacterium]|jgi:hypothetical protein
MKRLLPCLLTLLFNAAAFAVPVGNPALPSLLFEGCVVPDTFWSNPQLGVAGDYLISKRLKACHSVQGIDLHNATIEGTSEIATVGWNIRERFCLQGEVGSGQFFWQWQQVGQNVSGQLSQGLIWSGAAKCILLEMADTTLAVDAHAGGWNWMKGHENTDGRAVRGECRSVMRYWQVSAGLTQKIGPFAPYIGFATNRMRLKIAPLVTGTARMHQRHAIGPYGGCTLTWGSCFALNVEWRGWFEQGLTLSGQLRF